LNNNNIKKLLFKWAIFLPLERLVCEEKVFPSWIKVYVNKGKKTGKLFTEFQDLYSESGDKQNWYFSTGCLIRKIN